MVCNVLICKQPKFFHLFSNLCTIYMASLLILHAHKDTCQQTY